MFTLQKAQLDYLDNCTKLSTVAAILHGQPGKRYETEVIVTGYCARRMTNVTAHFVVGNSILISHMRLTLQRKTQATSSVQQSRDASNS